MVPSARAEAGRSDHDSASGTGPEPVPKSTGAVAPAPSTTTGPKRQPRRVSGISASRATVAGLSSGAPKLSALTSSRTGWPAMVTVMMFSPSSTSSPGACAARPEIGARHSSSAERQRNIMGLQRCGAWSVPQRPRRPLLLASRSASRFCLIT